MPIISIEQLQSTRTELDERRKDLLNELRIVEKALEGVHALLGLDSIDNPTVDNDKTANVVNGSHANVVNPTKPAKEFQSMPSAVDLILKSADGSLTYVEIKSHVKSVEPPVRVNNINGSLSATLSRGAAAGKYVRVDHGRYRWAQKDLGI